MTSRINLETMCDIFQAMAESLRNDSNAILSFPNEADARDAYMATKVYIVKNVEFGVFADMSYDDDSLTIRECKSGWEAVFMSMDTKVNGLDFHTLVIDEAEFGDGEDDAVDPCRDMVDVSMAFMAAVMAEESIVLVFNDKETAIGAFMLKSCGLRRAAKCLDDMDTYSGMNQNIEKLTFGGQNWFVKFTWVDEAHRFDGVDAIVIDCTEVEL